ncbi:MAG: hypothetical protein R3B99_32985 [Polyangiales bacterium]
MLKRTTGPAQLRLDLTLRGGCNPPTKEPREPDPLDGVDEDRRKQRQERAQQQRAAKSRVDVDFDAVRLCARIEGQAQRRRDGIGPEARRGELAVAREEGDAVATDGRGRVIGERAHLRIDEVRVPGGRLHLLEQRAPEPSATNVEAEVRLDAQDRVVEVDAPLIPLHLEGSVDSLRGQGEAVDDTGEKEVAQIE